MTDDIHADRREPETPAGAFDLQQAAQELLNQASELSAGRSARTLTPGAGAPLKQTLIALRSGSVLDKHQAPGPATIHVLQGEVTMRSDDEEVELREHSWAVIPTGPHDLQAGTDTAVLITVVNEAGARN